ncbi:DUF456 domain-containing protein [Halospeciosus flavus]|uniref:DUF456 domain-containing protein n=1 Tax=Halospeciosus flavus TaxID=3032283 RepID=A0ABD5Z295_9EURY|nr:DUF456 domain-containing protein [Halospeciosus flavus]
MVDVLLVAVVVLLVAGVVGTVTPLVPGALLSLAGVVLYWWSTGYTAPGLLLLATLVAVCLGTLLVDFFGGAIGAGAGGASRRTVAIAALVGMLLLFVAGPVGLVLGLAGTVFGLEYYRHEDAGKSARAAGYATVAVLASAVVQILLLGSVLVAMLLVVFL